LVTSAAARLRPRRRLLILATVVSLLILAAAQYLAGRDAGTAGAAPAPLNGSSARYPVRGIYDRDFSTTGFDREAALGFNFIDSGPSRDFDLLAARGLKGFVWLGGYSNDTCSFEESDAWVISHVTAIAGNPGVGAYFIDDEPDASECPNAPAQIKARSELVKSIDPGPPTFVVVYKVSQFALFAHTTDVLGLDHYPCSYKNGCDYSIIDEEAAEADRLGVRYWGVIQAWGEDDWYRLPTRSELHNQFVHWRATNMEGYLVFAWHYPDDLPALWLANHPGLQAQLDIENRGYPNTSIISGPAARTVRRRATFRFRSTEPGSSFRCRLDGGRWRPCSSPKVYQGLPRGRHTFRVRARDWVGNVDPTPAQRRWRIVRS